MIQQTGIEKLVDGVVDTIAVLKSLPVPTSFVVYNVMGYHSTGDGGGGQFYWDATSTAADNGGTVILPTGYTGSGRWLRNTSVFNVLGFGAKGDWDGTTGTIDSAAFQALTAAVVAAGGGHIVIPPRNYRITPAIGGVLCAFSNVAVSIDATGATLTDTNTYAAGDYATLFEFTACSVTVSGKPKFVTQQQDIGYGSATDLGLSALVFKQGCAPVDVDVEVDGGIYGVKFNRLSTDPLSYKSRNIKARVKANRVHYPYAAQFSGDSAQVDLDVTDCGRNFFLYGISDVHVRVRSVNQKVTSLIKSYAGLGCDEVTVDYYDRDSTSCNSAAPLLGLEWGDSTAAIHRNINIHLNCSNPAAAPRSHTISLSKYSDGGGTADTAGRGHVLDGFTLTGSNDNSTVAVNHVNLGAGAFAASDVFRNISIRDFTGLGSSSNVYMPLQVLADVSVWQNVVLRTGHIFTNNGTAGKVVFVGCAAANFTANTDSTDIHDYVGCNAYDGGSQNTTLNKRFVNTLVKTREIGTSHASAKTGANQSVAAATFTKVAFDTEIIDVLGNYDTAAYRFTAPELGVYDVSASALFSGNADAVRSLITIYLNGAESRRGTDTWQGAAGEITATVSCAMRLAAGDYVEVFVYCTAATTIVSNGAVTWFSISRVQ